MFNKIVVKIKDVFIPCGENDYKPKVLASNFLIYFLVGLIVLKFVSLGFLLEFPNNSFFADVSKTALVEMLNVQRGELGLGQLVENSQLNQAAEMKAQDMLDNDYFSHNSPQGVDPWYWLKLAGYNYHYAGENLGIGFVDSGEIHKAWNESPTHKENLLNANYNEIGIAILQGNFNGGYNTVVVQFFGTQQSVAPIASPIIVKKEEIEELPKQVVVNIAPEGAELFQEPSEPLQPQAATVVKPVEVVTDDSLYFVQEGIKPASIQGAVKGEYIVAGEESIRLRFFRFMSMGYDNLLQVVTFYALFAVTLFLIINIFVKVNIQHKGITIKVVVLLAFLIVCIYINKDVMLRFIPHVVSIY